MRLTLRTMLAYLDDILEPEDHQDIGRKIEESEFANSLVHRIRDVSRRMRLAAPKVAGRGMGLDPNTVAEYLDNTLPGERVPDFEKVCLESDIHLAEVASCHQILTLVLGEAAEVEPALRNRMYEIASRADESAAVAEERGAAAAGSAAADGAPRRDEPVHPVRPRPEVPDYLRSGSKSKFRPIAITAALAVCLVVVVILASGPLDGTNPVLKLFGFGRDTAPATAQNHPLKNDGGKPDQAQSARAASGNRDKTDNRGAEPGSPVADKTVSPADAKTSSTVDKAGTELPAKSLTAQPDPSKGLSAPGKIGEAATVVGPETADDKHLPIPPSPPTDLGNSSRTPQRVAKRPDGVSTEKGSIPAVFPDAVLPDAVPRDAARPDVVTPDSIAPAVGPATAANPFDAGRQWIGRLMTEQDVLLRMAAGQADWHRLAPGATFNTGDKLLVLPTFRPSVTLSSGITLQLVPETLIEFEKTEGAVPVVRVHYGRMVVRTTGKTDVKIKLAMADAVGTVNFDDAEATLGVEVRAYHLPGTEPERNEPRRAIALYGINGDVSWKPAGGAHAEKIQAPARLALTADPIQPAVEREIPKWVGAEPIGPNDARASQMLNELLDEKRPVMQALLEFSQHRRAENKSLAARSLALVSEFEPFVGLFNNPDERSVWPIQIESLQAALARGPAVAAKVREAFEKQRGKDGTELYRMLWGYSKDDLAGGAANRLVEYLDRDDMDFRVLSFHNLREITGATLNYRPEQSAANRQVPVRAWKDRLKGLIGPKTAPTVKPPASEPAASKSVPPPPTPDVP